MTQLLVFSLITANIMVIVTIMTLTMMTKATLILPLTTLVAPVVTGVRWQFWAASSGGCFCDCCKAYTFLLFSFSLFAAY